MFPGNWHTDHIKKICYFLFNRPERILHKQYVLMIMIKQDNVILTTPPIISAGFQANIFVTQNLSVHFFNPTVGINIQLTV